MLHANLDIRQNPHFKNQFVALDSPADIPMRWHNTPIEEFIRAQNFDEHIEGQHEPRATIVSCIEFRYALPVPAMFAYVIRRGGGRLIGSEFALTYTLVKGVRHVIMVAHNDCGMAKVQDLGPEVIDTLVDQGWDRNLAAAYVRRQIPRYAIPEEVEAQRLEWERVRRLFKRIELAPLFVSLHDKRLYLPKWYHDLVEEGLVTGSMHVSNEDIYELT